MRSLAFALVLVLVLSGATCQHRGEAPVADADPICYRGSGQVDVETSDTGVRWTCDAEKAECFDELGQKVIPELAGVALAEARGRVACAGFITDLKRRGIIRAKE